MAMTLQGTKHFVALNPVSLTAAGTAVSAVIDTRNYDELQFVVTKTTHATDYITSLTIESSDDTSTFATVSGYVAGTDFTVASLTGGTDAATLKPAAVINLALNGKKRYFRLSVTNGGATGIVGIAGTLARASQAPITAANAGVGQLVNPS